MLAGFSWRCAPARGPQQVSSRSTLGRTVTRHDGHAGSGAWAALLLTYETVPRSSHSETVSRADNSMTIASSERALPIVPPNTLRASGSSSSVTWSRTSKRGSFSTAIAIAARAASPPDSVNGSRASSAPRANASTIKEVRPSVRPSYSLALQGDIRAARFNSPAKVDFNPEKTRLGSLGTRATDRARVSGGSAATASPSSVTRSVGLSLRPVNKCPNAVFPVPLAPTILTHDPFSALNCTTGVWPGNGSTTITRRDPRRSRARQAGVG